MEYIPNTLTVLRIILSLLFFIIKPFSPIFFIIYSICGFSDILDGYIARKINKSSKVGALLDTIADMVMVCTLCIVLLPIIKMPMGVIYLVIIIATIRILSLIVIFYKYNTFAMLHTYANKLTGLALFILILLYPVIDSIIGMYLVCIIGIISSIEELLINVISNEILRDKKSIFIK